MVDKPFKVPVFAAALGAAFGFYCLSFGLHRNPVPYVSGLMFLMAGLVCAVNGAVFFRKFIFSFRDMDRPLKEFRIILISLVIGIILGTTAYSIQMKKTSPGIPPEKVTGVSGTLADDPHLLARGGGAFTLSLISARGKAGLGADASGPVQVFFPEELFNSLKGQGRGTRIFADGSFIVPTGMNQPNDPGLRFKARSIHVYENSSWLHSARTRVRLAIINSFEGKKWGGLALALLLGVRDFLDTRIAENYKFAGCSHVLALSGMHLGIISALVAFILKKPLGLMGATVLGALLIIGYVFLVGAQASLLRAAIMSTLGTLVLLRGYPRNMISLLSLAFIIQMVLYPASANTVSFMLSYLALGGILLLGPVFMEFLKGWVPDFLANPLSASLAAFLVTTPVTVTFFSMIRPVGILAGIVIVPVSTLFMVLSIIWFSLQPVPLANGLIGKILDFVYDILDLLVSESGKVPGVAVSNSGLLWITCILTCLILFLVYKKIRNVRTRFAPFA